MPIFDKGKVSSMRTLFAAMAVFFGFSISANAGINDLHKGSYGDGSNTVVQILDGTYLIYCRDGAPENTAWKCNRRKYQKTDRGFLVQYNRNVPREDSIVLEINKGNGGYQLVYRKPRVAVDHRSKASIKPVELKFKKAPYSGSFGPGKSTSVRFRNGRLRFCFKKKCSNHRVKSFGATVRAKFRNGDRLYVTPVSDTAVIGTYIESGIQYTVHYKIAQ